MWQSTDKSIWTGRDDSSEGALALRLFQTIIVANEFAPVQYANHTALLGFMCDEGVRLNKGRVGAQEAPNVIRKAMANLAAHNSHNKLVDLGNVLYQDTLIASQQALAECVTQCQQQQLKTVVLGGGHETAFAHGMGIYKVFPNKKIGIINFDAHLDIRLSKEGSSGTPFKQLADYCQEANRPFNYLCIGASLAANTGSLLNTADELGVQIIWDTECNNQNLANILARVKQFIESVDIVYLTVDLDVLPLSYMYAVSAPAAYGVGLDFLIAVADFIKNSGKLQAADFVEFNPALDNQGLCAKVAARFVWQILLNW
ncbi:formimidoylglutamase [Entomomonas sp. E2T0]|uniref:formimidoylglutamase n=1 Tax=Entomomonas sp. E2T0 TaxID=2930213 RepID=UPI00222827FE|nr:formimidoylglutamase [Entomomonas sp. E2T0]UYZ83595.1 formimidoylglutamase [Entomomonas sp. E2T0]